MNLHYNLEVTEIISISGEGERYALREKLKIRKLSARWRLHFLNADQK